ncbi:hypothetical protein JW964_00090, partial [candidate division KSB1 bacterium]|nr:hypothetical protein [candidate division KSB1 bacterium]
MKFKILFILMLLLGANVSFGQTSGEGVDFLYAQKLYNDSMYELAATQFHDFTEKYPQSSKTSEALFMAGNSYLK